MQDLLLPQPFLTASYFIMTPLSASLLRPLSSPGGPSSRNYKSEML